MTFDGLRAGLRVTFWCLVYLGTISGALLVFAPSPYHWAVWVAVVAIICHDAHHRLNPKEVKLDP